jgi:hypothetical protein
MSTGCWGVLGICCADALNAWRTTAMNVIDRNIVTPIPPPYI